MYHYFFRALKYLGNSKHFEMFVNALQMLGYLECNFFIDNVRQDRWNKLWRLKLVLYKHSSSSGFFLGHLNCESLGKLSRPLWFFPFLHTQGHVFIFSVSSLLTEFKRDEVNFRSFSANGHKYLQAALVADENVAAKHGNQTADFLLVLANIVSDRFAAVSFNFSVMCSAQGIYAPPYPSF